MDDLARNRMSSEKVSSIADRPWWKTLEPWWTYFSETFFLNVPQWVDLKLWNHWYPPHNLIPSLGVHLPPFWGVLGHLRTIFRSGSRWEMDVLYHVPLTFTKNPVRGWRIHHLWAWLWTGFTHDNRDTRERYLSCVTTVIYCQEKTTFFCSMWGVRWRSQVVRWRLLHAPIYIHV